MGKITEDVSSAARVLSEDKDLVVDRGHAAADVGPAEGLMQPAVFPVSLPCHWMRRFGGRR